MSGSDGPRGLDRGIAALRWLLVSAQDDDSARAQVLPALSRCTVLVPTMTGAPDKLRYLAHSSGGNAMLVFTGHDALEHASKRLGWAPGTQSVSFRAMSAREALETASLQGTRAVIVDAAAEHALELRYDEVSMYLSRGTAEFAPDFVEPSSRGTGEYGLPQRRSPAPSARQTGEHGQPPRKTNAPSGSRSTSEFSPRGTGERSVADLREEVAPRKARDARRDDDGGMRARVERAMAASEPIAEPEPPPEAKPPQQQPRARDQPTQPMENMAKPPDKRRRSSGSMKAAARKRNLAEIDDPFVSSTPRRAPSAGAAGGQARRVPSLAAPPLSGDMPSSPFESSRPPSSPTDAPPAPAPAPVSPMARRMASFNHERDQTIPLEDISTAKAARDSAARASIDVERSQPAPAQQQREENVPMDMFGRADSEPVGRPAVATRRVVTVSAPEPVAIPAPVAPAPVAHVAKEPQPEPRTTGTLPKPPPSVSEAPLASSLEDAGQTDRDELSETVLSAIADELRKFPEAEWACVLPEEGAHIVGVRVDPSYLQRTRDIEAAVANAARRAGELVQPMIVSTPAATKDARTRGRMFFPWKKKR